MIFKCLLLNKMSYFFSYTIKSSHRILLTVSFNWQQKIMLMLTIAPHVAYLCFVLHSDAFLNTMICRVANVHTVALMHPKSHSYALFYTLCSKNTQKEVRFKYPDDVLIQPKIWSVERLNLT